MKLRINICNIYLFVILLCALNGLLYTPGSSIAQGLQYVLIMISLYYAFYANFRYKLPLYFKALNVLLVLFTVYGVILLVGGDWTLQERGYKSVPNTEFLKLIYKSLLPVYPFYVFTKQGLLKENTIKRWFLVFLVLTIHSFYKVQANSLKSALTIGSSQEEFTNNTGYQFLALLPALVIFNKKPFVQYLGIAICTFFILMAMKRGAILIGAFCLLWFFVINLKNAQKKRKWIVVTFTLVLVISGLFLVNYVMETSAYFQYRIDRTKEGDSSGRDELFNLFYNHFIHENNLLHLLFGNGANSTLKIGGEYAHNDWLEIAINHGIMGLLVFLAYWICFYITWRKVKAFPQVFMAVGLLFFIYFLSTLFSMSYNNMTRCASMVLGYYLAIGFEKKEPFATE